MLKRLASMSGIFFMCMSFATSPEVSIGKLHKLEPFVSEYFDSKNVYIWLPPNYNSNTTYAVLYMHDGQQLFDASVTWNNQEWGVDETAARLQSEKITREFIVVAISNGNINGRYDRHREYFPKKVFDLLPKDRQEELMGRERNGQPLFSGPIQSDDYLKFLVNELKPYIDKTYSVRTDKDNTFIAGSSMGGLISMYALSEYPNVFGGAACISTHWLGVSPSDKDWLPEYFFHYMSSQLPLPGEHKLYFDFGTETLDQHYPPLQALADQILEAKGYDESNWQTRRFEGAAHDENSWQERLHIPLIFLLKE